MNWFFLLLGHLVGDYICQTKWMAQNKVRHDSIGYTACMVHCLVYSIVLSMIMIPVLPSPDDFWVMFLIAFVSHYPIDKGSLAKYWMKYVLGSDVPSNKDPVHHHVLWWIVYIVNDNTAHLLLMTLGMIYLI
jgi:membrane protein YqaA with SNARE-associated domain